MASDNLERNLHDGIEAARRGDKLTARRLLQQVLQVERTNETALIWMASVVDTVPEKRAYLEQVLRVNPHNDRARQALERMGGAPPPPARPAASSSTAAPPRPAPAPKPAGNRSGINRYFMAAIGVGAVMAVILLVFFITQPGEPADEPASTVTSAPTALAMLDLDNTGGTQAPEALPPTATPGPAPTSPGVIVTLDRALAALPATFTPTPTLEPTATFTPSATPIPLSDYALIYAAAKPGQLIPSLFVARADGSAIREVGDNRGYYDIALSPDKTQIAFVRDVAPEGSDQPDWQLFTAPVSDPANARQITSQPNAALQQPVWAADGRSIVFAANTDGDLDLFRAPASPGGAAEPVALTNTPVDEAYPAFSPDGQTLIFVSDLNTPGFPRLFTLNENGVARPFSNVTGSISDPVYSPDGSRIAYINRQSGDPDIWVITAAGERPFQLTINDSANDRSIAWSDDGQWIAFASDRVNDRFMWYLLNVNTQQVVPLGDLAEAQSIAFLPR